MSFQKLVTLVALAMFASQGAIAAPFPHPDGNGALKPLLDSLLQNAGHIFGVVGGDITPAAAAAQTIKGAGGIPPKGKREPPTPQPPTPQPLADSLLDNVEGSFGTAFHDLLPQEVTDQAIKGAGGSLKTREEEYPARRPFPIPHPRGDEPLLDTTFGDLGTISGTIGHDVLPAESVNDAIKAAGGKVDRRSDDSVVPHSPARRPRGDEPLEPVLDSALGNSGTILGTIGHDVLPAEFIDDGIKAAGGKVGGRGE